LTEIACVRVIAIQVPPTVVSPAAHRVLPISHHNSHPAKSVRIGCGYQSAPEGITLLHFIVLKRYIQWGLKFQSSRKEQIMTDKEIQKVIEEINSRLNALAEQQLTLATTANQLSKFIFNSETLLEVVPKPESREASNFLLDRFLQHSKNYRKYAATEGRWALDCLATEEALDSMRATTAEGKSAVAGIAEMVVRESIRRGKEITNATTKFVGMVVSFLMESNGYRQIGKVSPIPCGPFTKGQIYRLIES
jgi:hypothetical protein